MTRLQTELDRWIGRPLEALAVGYGYALFAVGIGSIIATVVFALVTGTWLLLVILIVPAIWFVMWKNPA